MTKTVSTDFTSIKKYDLDRRHGFPPHLNNETTKKEYPNSEMVEGECPGSECSFSGTAVKSYGWNSYYRCPSCEQAVIVSG